MPENDPQAIAARATQSYEQGNFEQAASLFAEAALAFEQAQNLLDAAEMRNNQSVALLKHGDAQAAFDVLQGVGDVFVKENDVFRQAFFIGNEAAALDALGRLDEAEARYRASARLLDEVAEYQLRSSITKSLAWVLFRRYKFLDGLRAYGSALIQRAMHMYLRMRLWFPPRA